MAQSAPEERRVALVTGASRRCAIGAAIVTRLVSDGLRVLVHGWGSYDETEPGGGDPGGPEALVSGLRAQGGELEYVAVDLAHPDAPERLAARARDVFGRLDVLVANHARSGAQSLARLTAEEIDLTYAVNTRATLLLARGLAEHYGGGPGGRVVLFTSGQYHGAMADELPYIASKGALHQLTRSLAVALMPRGITVNTVDPGPTHTGYADPQTHAAVAAQIPGGRWGTPQDAARLVAWLVGPEAGWVTGQVIASDGGWSAQARPVAGSGRDGSALLEDLDR